MEKQIKEFKKKIEHAKDILIVTHNGPDMDAFCSMLLLKKFLNIAYPSKNVKAISKRAPSFNIPGMHEVKIVRRYEPGEEDLIIMTDVGSWDLILSEEDDVAIKEFSHIIIDHHETTYDSEVLNINDGLSSATEQVIVIFEKLLGKKFAITNDIAQLGQYGIIADTGRFMYINTSPDCIRLFADLYEFSPVNIEEIEYKSNKFPEGSIKVMTELLKTLVIIDDMAYVYMDADTIKKNGFEIYEVNQAFIFIKNNFLRYIQGVHWGFLLKPHTGEENTWQVSFRSAIGYREVDNVAEKLGGGGHKHSSGAILKFEEEKNINEVLELVLSAIETEKS